MEGASVPYNAYWIRFVCRHTTLKQTAENSKVFSKAAERVGRER